MKKIINIIIVIMIHIGAMSQTYPPIINLDNVLNENYTPPLNTPNYLESFTNEYGYEVTRVSDIDIFNVNSQQLGHNYSKDQPWNSDGTLIKLAGYPAAILDGETFELLYWRDIPSVARWANTESDYMYGTLGNRFVKFNVHTNTTEVLITFNEFSSVSFGYGESNQDNNDRYVGLIGDDSYFIVYDIWNNTYDTLTIPNGNLDWFSVSSLGNYAIALWSNYGNDYNQGLKRYNIDLTNETHLSDSVQHGDLGLLEDNSEVYVQMGGQNQWNNDYYIEMVNLTTGNITNLFEWSPLIHGTSGIWGGHVSMRSDRKGIVYINEGCCYNHTTLPNEIFALNLNGNNTIERYGKHHSNRYGNENGNHSARAVPNRDGTKILFVSNWFNSDWEDLNSGYTFILEIPQKTLNIEQQTINEKILEKKYYNMLGQYLGKIKPKQSGIYIVVYTYLNREESKIEITKY